MMEMNILKFESSSLLSDNARLVPFIATAAYIVSFIVINALTNGTNSNSMYPGSAVGLYRVVELSSVFLSIPLSLSCLMELFMFPGIFTDNIERIALTASIGIKSFIELILLEARIDRIDTWLSLFSRLPVLVCISAMFSYTCKVCPNKLLKRLSHVFIICLSIQYAFMDPFEQTSSVNNIFAAISCVMAISLVCFLYTHFREPTIFIWSFEKSIIWSYFIFAIILGCLGLLTRFHFVERPTGLLTVNITMVIFVFGQCSLRLVQFFIKMARLQHEKNQVIRYVLHEVSTPLNIMRGGLSLLSDEILINEASALKADLIGNLNSSITEAIDAISDLMDYESINENKFGITKANLEVSSLFSESQLETYALLARPKEVKFESKITYPCSDIEPTLCLYGDEKKLSKVFRILITNALKSTPRHGSVSVELRSSNLDGAASTPFLEVLITESGIGIEEDALKHIFTQYRAGFFSLNKMESKGLGLVILQSIVELHGGTISATSEGRNRGSTFVVRLPLFKKAPDSAQDDSKGLNGSHARRDFLSVLKNMNSVLPLNSISISEDLSHNQTISDLPIDANSNVTARKSIVELNLLLVDDSVLSLQMVRHQLNKLFSSVPDLTFKCDYTLANDGKTALQEVMKLRNSKGLDYDFVLMDNYMLEMNGPETAREMKRIPDFSSIIIGITGNIMQDQVDEFIDSGADAVLGKPVDINELGNHILTGIQFRADRNAWLSTMV